LGAPEWARDARYADADFRFEQRREIESRMAPWLLTQRKAQFAWEAQRRALPFAPVNTVADLLKIPQLHFRRFFRTANAQDGRPCVVPGQPFVVASSEARTEVEGRDVSPPAPAASSRPLHGVRVVDFGHVWAGPYCAALLADMGAEVIKVESAQRLDVHRRQGPYAEGRVGVNRSGVWNAQNRGKRSVTLNLSTDRGRALARALVATGDVVIENFAPGVMKRLGLDYSSLCAVKPDLIMASLSAFGQQGPQQGYVGYGPSLDAWAGLDALTAYEDGAPNALGGIFPDTGSALHAAAAILAALHRRGRTRAGCHIDVSELEVSVLLLGDLVTRELAGDRVRATGNSDGTAFPQRAFRCAGDDRWIALSVVDAASWKGLCTLLGRDDWLRDPALETSEGRRVHGPAIERAIAHWASSRDGYEAMVDLQRHGIPAGVAHDARTLLADPHLSERGFFATLVHPEAGEHRVYGPIWRIVGADDRFDTPAPALGADNDYVLDALLGISRDEIASLVAERIVY
jgi:crotonobetainyl-CoA:carnitine CoA-transferase CaiB-like acyl-CoA transferase